MLLVKLEGGCLRAEPRSPMSTAPRLGAPGAKNEESLSRTGSLREARGAEESAGSLPYLGSSAVKSISTSPCTLRY